MYHKLLQQSNKDFVKLGICGLGALEKEGEIEATENFMEPPP